jgi:hypothetical protein
MTGIRTFLEETIFVANRQRKLPRNFFRPIYSRSKKVLARELPERAAAVNTSPAAGAPSFRNTLARL